MAKVASKHFEGFGWDTGGSGCLVQLLKERLDFFSGSHMHHLMPSKTHPRIYF
jgi:hypothetical protein